MNLYSINTPIFKKESHIIDNDIIPKIEYTRNNSEFNNTNNNNNNNNNNHSSNDFFKNNYYFNKPNVNSNNNQYQEYSNQGYATNEVNTNQLDESNYISKCNYRDSNFNDNTHLREVNQSPYLENNGLEHQFPVNQNTRKLLISKVNEKKNQNEYYISNPNSNLSSFIKYDNNSNFKDIQNNTQTNLQNHTQNTSLNDVNNMFYKKNKMERVNTRTLNSNNQNHFSLFQNNNLNINNDNEIMYANRIETINTRSIQDH
tara:strand:- start:84 stop:857 length:774 start_codon:yes stop_codon:yes gene_type:complete